jgi:hypothetical protein
MKKRDKKILLIISLSILLMVLIFRNRHHSIEPFILSLVNSSNIDSFIRQNYSYFDSNLIGKEIFNYSISEIFGENSNIIKVLGYKANSAIPMFYRKSKKSEIITVYSQENDGRLRGITFHIRKRENNYLIYKIEIFNFG